MDLQNLALMSAIMTDAALTMQRVGAVMSAAAAEGRVPNAQELKDAAGHASDARAALVAAIDKRAAEEAATPGA